MNFFHIFFYSFFHLRVYTFVRAAVVYRYSKSPLELPYRIIRCKKQLGNHVHTHTHTRLNIIYIVAQAARSFYATSIHQRTGGGAANQLPRFYISVRLFSVFLLSSSSSLVLFSFMDFFVLRSRRRVIIPVTIVIADRQQRALPYNNNNNNNNTHSRPVPETPLEWN